MFNVSGYIDGVAYQAVIGGDTSGADPSRVAGCTVTDPETAAWLEERNGQPWQATPTGPSGVTDLADPGSVLGTLYDHTTVTGVDGDAPDLLGPDLPGVVY